MHLNLTHSQTSGRKHLADSRFNWSVFMAVPENHQQANVGCWQVVPRFSHNIFFPIFSPSPYTENVRCNTTSPKKSYLNGSSKCNADELYLFSRQRWHGTSSWTLNWLFFFSTDVGLVILLSQLHGFYCFNLRLPWRDCWKLWKHKEKCFFNSQKHFFSAVNALTLSQSMVRYKRLTCAMFWPPFDRDDLNKCIMFAFLCLTVAGTFINPSKSPKSNLFLFSFSATETSKISQQINVIRHAVQQKAIPMWQDVRLSNKFLKQTNNSTHYNTITQVKDSSKSFLTGQLVQLHHFLSKTHPPPPPPVILSRLFVLLQMGG